MTREPYTLGPDNSLADARRLMSEHHIRHIPIVSGECTVLGVVSQRDVSAAEDSSVLNPSPGSGENYVALSTIMSSPVQWVDEHASLRGCALQLQKHKMGCLPVVKDGRLVGIITDSDFLAVAINLMEQLEMSEPEELDFEGD
jgi:CBS domain-containing protein